MNNTDKTAAPVSATKAEICALLRAFVNQRPGLDFANYGNVSSYRSEVRGITRQRNEALQLIRAIELRDSITAADMRDGFRAFSGRLSLVEVKGTPALEYCAGQYYPTEYRAAVCAVCASVIWAYMRGCMPKPSYDSEMNQVYTICDGSHPLKHVSAGAWLRRHFRREFGRGIQSRWFN